MIQDYIQGTLALNHSRRDVWNKQPVGLGQRQDPTAKPEGLGVPEVRWLCMSRITPTTIKSFYSAAIK